MDDSNAKLDALRTYLANTDTDSVDKARAEAIFELAPGVWGVLDRCQGRTEYDVYFDLDRAALTDIAKRESRARYPSLNSLGIDCLGFGPGMSDHIFRLTKERLQLKGNATWNEEPRQIDL